MRQKRMGMLYYKELPLRSHRKFLTRQGRMTGKFLPIQSRSASLEGLEILLLIVFPTW